VVPALANRSTRGAVLLECLLALALFVACGLAVMAMMDRAASSVATTRDSEIAVDVARTAMAKLEAGLATAETLNGPVPAWRDERDGTFDESLPTGAAWNLEIHTEPSQFEGLTKVSVRAFKQTVGSENELASYTLHQLVRLGPADTRPARDTRSASRGGA
jgi:hypothetical protein